MLIVSINIVYGVTLNSTTTFKVATYNVENLFDLKKSGREYPEYIPNNRHRWNRTTYKKKLENLAKVIKDIDADIIALEEIESYQALHDLKAMLQRKGIYYPYSAFAGKKNTTIKNALLSKYKIAYSKELTISSNRRYRSILEVKVKVKSEYLYIFVNHWKAKSGPESRRIVSAKALRKRLNQLGHDKDIVLVGDFNSHYEEYKTFLKKRRHNDTHGKTGINHILKTIEGKRLITLEDLKHTHKYYANLWLELPKSERWSHQYGRKYEALDSIIISPGLYDGKNIDYVKNSFHRFIAPYIINKKGKIVRWKMSKRKPKVHLGKGYSDHLALYATFKVY